MTLSSSSDIHPIFLTIRSNKSANDALQLYLQKNAIKNIPILFLLTMVLAVNIIVQYLNGSLQAEMRVYIVLANLALILIVYPIVKRWPKAVMPSTLFIFCFRGTTLTLFNKWRFDNPEEGQNVNEIVSMNEALML